MEQGGILREVPHAHTNFNFLAVAGTEKLRKIKSAEENLRRFILLIIVVFFAAENCGKSGVHFLKNFSESAEKCV